MRNDFVTVVVKMVTWQENTIDQKTKAKLFGDCSKLSVFEEMDSDSEVEPSFTTKMMFLFDIFTLH